jgi:hypothetical protein
MDSKLVAYNSGTVTAYGTKYGNHEVGVAANDYRNNNGGLKWYNSPNYGNNDYVMISNTYDLGLSTQGNSKPLFWTATSDEIFIAIVNKLHENRNSTPLTTIASAISWVNASNKYYLINQFNYTAGLYKTTYNGYFADDVNFFAIATPQAFGTNPITEVQKNAIFEPATDDGSDFSCQWLGYFKPTTSETYTFYTSSDDASYMWIGANAQTGFTTTNATVNNGGLHGTLEKSGSISLTANTYYPVRIQFGERNGGDVLTFNYSTPTITKTTTVTGLVFYNSTTNNF